jgi:hypothetical protein
MEPLASSCYWLALILLPASCELSLLYCAHAPWHASAPLAHPVYYFQSNTSSCGILASLFFLAPLQNMPPVGADASDPLAATLENVPFVPLLAKTPAAALIDLVAFTNGQTGKDSPQRQGLQSAIKDGLSPLNIAANTPASPAYSPLWAVNLAKWVGQPGDRQTSVSAVQVRGSGG